MSINTGDHLPIAKKPYALALKHYDWVRDEIDKLHKAGVIQESHSSWSAPIVVVPKGDGGKRICMDFRALNAIYRTYVWPMPRVKEVTEGPGFNSRLALNLFMLENICLGEILLFIKTSLLNWVKQSSSPHFI